MYNLLQSIKKIIDRKVVNIQTFRQNISAGDTVVSVKSAKRFMPYSDIVFFREGEDEGEVNKIASIDDWKTITLENPVAENYNTNTGRITNMIYGGQWVNGVYIGDPPVIPRYPAITVYGESRSSEWLTLDSTRERFQIAISVYIENAHYDDGYEYVLKLTTDIERALFHNFYPLVLPYCTTVLLEDVSETDTVIRIEHDDLNRYFKWFFIENDQYTRNASPRRYLDNGVVELNFPIGVPFSAGDDVIFPGRHFYDTRAESTEYGNVVKNSLLWGSRISYFAVEEVLRPNNFYEAIYRP